MVMGRPQSCSDRMGEELHAPVLDVHLDDAPCTPNAHVTVPG
jgi:hypothetical protein